MKRTIAIQVGAISFIDEGVEQVRLPNLHDTWHASNIFVHEIAQYMDPQLPDRSTVLPVDAKDIYKSYASVRDRLDSWENSRSVIKRYKSGLNGEGRLTILLDGYALDTNNQIDGDPKLITFLAGNGDLESAIEAGPFAFGVIKETFTARYRPALGINPRSYTSNGLKSGKWVAHRSNPRILLGSNHPPAIFYEYESTLPGQDTSLWLVEDLVGGWPLKKAHRTPWSFEIASLSTTRSIEVVDYDAAFPFYERTTGAHVIYPSEEREEQLMPLPLDLGKKTLKVKGTEVRSRVRNGNREHIVVQTVQRLHRLFRYWNSEKTSVRLDTGEPSRSIYDFSSWGQVDQDPAAVSGRSVENKDYKWLTFIYGAFVALTIAVPAWLGRRIRSRQKAAARKAARQTGRTTGEPAQELFTEAHKEQALERIAIKILGVMEVDEESQTMKYLKSLDYTGDYKRDTMRITDGPLEGNFLYHATVLYMQTIAMREKAVQEEGGAFHHLTDDDPWLNSLDEQTMLTFHFVRHTIKKGQKESVVTHDGNFTPTWLDAHLGEWAERVRAAMKEGHGLASSPVEDPVKSLFREKGVLPRPRPMAINNGPDLSDQERVRRRRIVMHFVQGLIDVADLAPGEVDDIKGLAAEFKDFGDRFDAATTKEERRNLGNQKKDRCTAAAAILEGIGDANNDYRPLTDGQEVDFVFSGAGKGRGVTTLLRAKDNSWGRVEDLMVRLLGVES